MSLKSRRRLLLHSEVVESNETVFASNYEPNGEAFYYSAEWDADNDTVYVEWINRKQVQTSNFMSFAGTTEINKIVAISSWRGDFSGVLHCYSNPVYNNSYRDGELMICFLPRATGGYEKRVFINLNDNVNKLMLNANGLYINGVLVGNASTVYNQSQTNIFASLAENPYIILGSEEGSNRSYDRYNKISIIHEKYTGERMAELTAI